MKIDRLLSIVMHLLSRDQASASDLAERFGVTVRTIQRDMEAIDAAGIPVTAVHGPNGGYRILDTFRLDRQFLTFDDLFFITTALQGIGDSLESGAVQKTADKIRSLASRHPAGELASRAERLVIDFSALGHSARRKEHLALIQKALERNRCLSFNYTSARLETLRRVVEPHAIVFKWYSWYLFAWCRLRGEFRLFRISRIRDPELLPEAFRRRPVNVREHLERMADAVPPGLPVVLRFLPEARVMAEEYFSFADLSADPEGRLIARFELPEDNWLYGTILSWGNGVEVVSPEHLRRKIAEICRKNLEIYNDCDIGLSHTLPQNGDMTGGNGMEIKDVSQRKTASIRIRTTVGDLSRELGRGYGEIMGLLTAQGIRPEGAPFAMYHNMDMNDLDVEMGFPVASPCRGEGRMKPGTIPGGRTAVGVHRGSYDSMKRTYGEMSDFIKENKAVPQGLCYEFYLNDPQTTKPEELLTEIGFPLKG